MRIERNSFIERMKQQTIGVEVEMFGINRKRAAVLTAKFFGTYVDDSSIGWEQHRDVYYCLDQQGRKWKYAYDCSIRQQVSNYPQHLKCELNTPVLTYDDIPTLQEVLRMLRKEGAKSNPENSCGIHVHIGADLGKEGGHTPQSLRNLTNLMKAHESILIESISIPWNRRRYCKTTDSRWVEAVNKQKPKTIEEFRRCWYKSQGEDPAGNIRHYNETRYHMLNLHSLFDPHGHGTIEFRCFQFDNPSQDRKGGIHAGMVKAYIQLCLAMSQYSKEVTRTTPNENLDSNHKYAMRCWLLRLGFIGKEFETARDVLTRRLSGNAAYSGNRAA